MTNRVKSTPDVVLFTPERHNPIPEDLVDEVKRVGFISQRIARAVDVRGALQCYLRLHVGGYDVVVTADDIQNNKGVSEVLEIFDEQLQIAKKAKERLFALHSVLAGLGVIRDRKLL